MRTARLAVGLIAGAALFPSIALAAGSTVPPDDTTATADTGAGTPAATDGSWSTIVDATRQTLSAPSRVQLYVDIDGLDAELDGDVPILTVEFAGSAIAARYDLSLPLAAAGITVPKDVDATIEARLIDGYVYLHAPLVGQLGAAVVESVGDVGDVGDSFWTVVAGIGDGWARIALPADELGMEPSQLDLPTMLPALLTFAEDQIESVTSLGSADVNGVASEGYRVTTISSGSDAFPPIDIWIGADGNIQRVEVEVSASTLGRMAPIPTTATTDELAFVLRADWVDHGSTDIEITAPAEFVDITDQLDSGAIIDEMDVPSVATMPAPPAPEPVVPTTTGG